MTVYYRSPFGKSAKKLAGALGMDYRRLRPGSRPRCRINCSGGCIDCSPEDHPVSNVAWGAPDVEGSLNGGIRCGKLHQLQVWNDAELRTVPFSTERHDGWLARGVNHFGGNDFNGHVSTVAYYTKPIPSSVEYRMHVFRYKNTRGNPANYMTARVGWKVNEEPEKNRESCGVPIRSRQFGWKLKYYNASNTVDFVRRHPNADLLARWAIATLDWDFGAIDMIKGQDGRYYLLEANSAPGLSDQATLNCYAHRINAILGR